VPWVIAVIIVSVHANRAGTLPLPLADWQSYSLSALLAVLGILILILGIKACPMRVVMGFGSSVLVKRGIYSYTRNPICLSCILLSFSAAIGFKSGSGLAVAALCLLVAYLRALLWEERELERRFGSEYSEYKHKVGMFIPKPPYTGN
jgi:protein-S-isoprenylcysteine O-methyltransferase Ste14